MVWAVKKAYITMKQESDPASWLYGFLAGWLVSFLLVSVSVMILFMW